jgi:hypothetical protein
MKKTDIIALAAVVGIGLIAASPRKSYTLTDGQIGILYNSLQVAKKAIPTSDAISAREASAGLQGIDSIEKVIVRQYVDTLK